MVGRLSFILWLQFRPLFKRNLWLFGLGIIRTIAVRSVKDQRFQDTVHHRSFKIALALAFWIWSQETKNEQPERLDQQPWKKWTSMVRKVDWTTSQIFSDSISQSSKLCVCQWKLGMIIYIIKYNTHKQRLVHPEKFQHTPGKRSCTSLSTFQSLKHEKNTPTPWLSRGYDGCFHVPKVCWNNDCIIPLHTRKKMFNLLVSWGNQIPFQ